MNKCSYIELIQNTPLKPNFMLDFLKSLFGSAGTSVDLGELYKNGAVIIDVRTAAEYADGHVNGSKNIPLDRISAETAKIKKMNKPVITCCRSGARSAQAASILKAAGVDVYNGGPWQAVRDAISS
jgi:rhodanese-related sulfurtransferase